MTALPEKMIEAGKAVLFREPRAQTYDEQVAAIYTAMEDAKPMTTFNTNASDASALKLIERVNRAFDLLEGLRDAWRKVDQAKGDDISAGFSRNTGGIDVEYLIEKLGPPRTPITSSPSGIENRMRWYARTGDFKNQGILKADCLDAADRIAELEAALTAKLSSEALVEALRQCARLARMEPETNLLANAIIETVMNALPPQSGGRAKVSAKDKQSDWIVHDGGKHSPEPLDALVGDCQMANGRYERGPAIAAKSIYWSGVKRYRLVIE